MMTSYVLKNQSVVSYYFARASSCTSSLSDLETQLQQQRLILFRWNVVDPVSASVMLI